MNLLKIYKEEILIWSGLIIVFGLTRLVSLTILPVFVDEAIYVRWSQVLWNDPANRFIPLTDGKQPLFMWLAAPLTQIFTDPLFASRLISVIAGFFGMAGMFLIGRELADKRFGFFASLLYVLTPFIIFYDRLAVPDGLLSSFGVWALYLSILLVRRLRLDVALILGAIIGFATLTKTPGFFYLALLPTSLLLFKFKEKNSKYKFAKLICLWALVFVISFGMYNLLRLSPLFYLISQRQPDFVFSVGEVLQHPFDPFLGRIVEIFLWLGGYLTWPVFLMSITGFFLMAKNGWRMTLYILAWSLLPLLAEAQIAKGFTPRYFIFTVPPLILTAGYFLVRIFDANLRSFKLVIFALLIPAVIFDLFLILDPQKAAIPPKERSGYLEEWSSGYGIAEIADYLKTLPVNQPVLVGTEGSFGTLPDGLMIYLTENQNITVVGMGQPAAIHKLPQTLIDNAKDKPVFLVVNKSRINNPDDSRLELVASYPKAMNQEGLRDSLLFFKVKSIEENNTSKP